MERIELTKDRKITLYAVSIAFFLSFLIGLIAGNPLAVVFVRAIVSSILFGAVLFGGLYLLRRFIPELTGAPEMGGGAAAAESRSDDVGGRVDYTVSDTAENARADAVTVNADIPERMAEASTRVAGDEGIPDLAEAGLEGAEPAGIEESDEVLTPVAETAGSDVSPESSLEDITLEPLDGMDDEEEGKLPSLDRLFEDTEQEEYPDIAPSSSGGGGSGETVGGYIQVGDARIPNEPEALAKAVKKVMNQDE
jgi:hypothetical protein